MKRQSEVGVSVVISAAFIRRYRCYLGDGADTNAVVASIARQLAGALWTDRVPEDWPARAARTNDLNKPRMTSSKYDERAHLYESMTRVTVPFS